MYPIDTARYIIWRINERLNLDERGQVASEYIGIIIVIAAIIAALVTAGPSIGTAISNGIKAAIKRVVDVK